MSKMPHNAPAGFDWLTGFDQWRLEDNILWLQAQSAAGETAQISFRALSADVWRMTFAPMGAALTPTPIILDQSPSLSSLDVQESATGLSISAGNLNLLLDRSPWYMRLQNADGRDLLRENPTDIDGLGQPFVLPLGFVRAAWGISHVSQSFHLRQDEQLYGLGEKFTPLDKVGQRIITWTQDAFGSTSERSHKNMPFLMSSRGYGLLLDTGARVTWDLGTISCQSASLLAETDTLDAYIIYGPSYEQILQRYADLTGRTPLPPKWTFGLWVSSGGTYRDQETMQTLVDGLEEHDVPADVVHIDPWWMKWRTYCDFRWDRNMFPDVEAMIADWHARGLKICLWEHPYISIESDLFEYGQAQDYFLKRPDGETYIIDYGLSLAPRPDGIVRQATPETSWNARVAIVDFTNEDAYRWFQDLHRPLLQMGVDVFKTDFGEDVPHDALFSNGQTGATMHNLYPLLYNQCVYEVTQEERGYGVLWLRAGAAGIQRFPICWSGDPATDFDSLACTIRGGLSIGMSGVPFWSNDIGAYREMPSPHLYIRWAQVGLFCSHSRMHGDSPREPWAFGDEALDIVRRYVKLRYQLFPYIYSAAHEAMLNHTPVIRAMPLAFPDDPNTQGKDLQYMFGPDILVAPIYDEGESRLVYLPDGDWVDFWTKERIRGPVNIRVHAPLDCLPLFVRAGAAIPLIPPAERIPEGRIDPLILEVYPASQIESLVYEDEGMTTISGSRDDQGLTIRWQSDVERRLMLRIVNSEKVAQVTGAVLESWRQVDEVSVECQISASQQGELRIEFA